MRLLVEAALFILAVLTLRSIGAATRRPRPRRGVLLHYALAYDRVRALLTLS